MTDLEELTQAHKLVSDLRHTNERLQQDHHALHDRIQAKEDIIRVLKAQLIAQREIQNQTPPLGNSPIETDTLTRKI